MEYIPVTEAAKLNRRIDELEEKLMSLNIENLEVHKALQNTLKEEISSINSIIKIEQANRLEKRLKILEILSE